MRNPERGEDVYRVSMLERLTITRMNSVKLVVLGDDSVGKSAVTVRFLTRRYIGEYESNTDLVYKQCLDFNDTKIELEILDAANRKNTPLPGEDAVNWADAFVVIYSICDRLSFERARYMIESIHLARAPSHVPVLLIGNKLDLEQYRVVGSNEGTALAEKVGCQFAEVSAAESVQEVTHAFEIFLKEVTALSPNAKRRKNSFGTVSKAITSFFSKNKNLNQNAKRKVLIY